MKSKTINHEKIKHLYDLEVDKDKCSLIKKKKKVLYQNKEHFLKKNYQKNENTRYKMYEKGYIIHTPSENSYEEYAKKKKKTQKPIKK